MDYELYEELKMYMTHALESKGRPKEVLVTLTSLIEHVAEYFIDVDEEAK